jgi:hypothetical protein
MRRIADGDLNVDIQDNRGDEIADMGRALLFFRQATAEAATARRKESERTRTLESRRQLVEAATQEFERAVSNIVKTLDRAAAAMDSSARDMANSATRNQEQALATAAASSRRRQTGSWQPQLNRLPNRSSTSRPASQTQQQSRLRQPTRPRPLPMPSQACRRRSTKSARSAISSAALPRRPIFSHSTRPSKPAEGLPLLRRRSKVLPPKRARLRRKSRGISRR